MKKLLIISTFLYPSMVLAQTPDPMVQLPASLVQKLWQAAGDAPYKTVRPVEDELNRALHPPAQTSGTNYPDPKNNLPSGPQGGPGQPPVTPPPPSVGEHNDDAH